MCGRFAQVFELLEIEHLERILKNALAVDQDLVELFSSNYTKNYNAAPTQYATILAVESPTRLSATQAHFGLIPSWAKDRSRSGSMINARSETINEKPAYRNLFKSKRCVLPVNGFYEWQQVQGSKSKQPWFIHRADEQPMFLAGIWDTWLDPEHGQSEVDSFSLITTHANDFMMDIHHRMPIVLEPEALAAWFDRDAQPSELATQLNPASEGILSAYRVSTRVNSAQNNDPALIEPDSGASEATLF